MILSVSQLKTYNSSPAKWAGKYILKLKDGDFSDDSFALGQLIETWIMEGVDDFTILDKYNLFDKNKVLETYEVLKYNATGLNMPVGTPQVKVEGEMLGAMFIGYIDNLVDDTVFDIKSTLYLSSEGGARNHWSGLTTYEEYELQLWVYMKLTGLKKASIAEISKHKYKDGRNANQIIEFNWTDEMDERLTNKYGQIVKEIIDLHNKFNFDGLSR